MKALTLEIKPKEGLGELKFGESSEKLISMLGEAEEMEDIEDEDEFNTVILNYWDKGISAFFEGKENSVLSCFEVDNPETILFGQKVFELSENEIIELMKENGYSDIDTDVEENGEKRLSFEDGMIDFFFDDDSLLAVNWGVLVNDQGEIEHY
ncbi:MAG: hypothetical protein K9G58_07735 [Bacteroidales bacterium]|nr:hypothetical protein [Bacteroidales bacterium]MCF8387328.1 hypothetical protein [Bacteroidales bacterium]MCF8398040.1 hypothetical protein [Bacteroidales bacterium]